MGFYIFAIGLIVAIIGAAKPAPAPGDWSDTVLYFWVGAVISGIGCFLWRRQIRLEMQASANQTSSEAGVAVNGFELLKEFDMHLKEFDTRISSFNADQLFEAAEKYFDDFITPIVDRRYDFIHKLGMSQGAEIVLAFSKGERYFNRMHTAALDGHLEEALSAWPLAKDAFREAIAKV